MKSIFVIREGVRRIRLLNQEGSILLLSGVIGIIGGLVALGFHSLLEYLNHHIIGQIQTSDNPNGYIPYAFFWMIPAIGGMLSGFLVYKFAPETAGHGTDAMINTFHNKGGKVRKRVPIVKTLSSILTISSGGSAGYEGPVAQVGSGIGSMLTRMFHLHPHHRRILTLSGTAAGLGAIFKAPLGGALTSVEVLYKEDFESEGFLTSIIASVVGYITYCSFTNYSPVFASLPHFGFANFKQIGFYLLLGIVLAPFSFLYVKIFYAVKKKSDSLKIHNYFKPAIGGLLVGILFYFEPRIIGGGWEYLLKLSEVSSGNLAFAFSIFTLAILKMFATSFTVGSGGSGGVFGPSLFIGGMLGGSLGLVCDMFFPMTAPLPGAMVLVGMGAFFSGAANAPIASVIMVCELTGNYELLAPLMLSSVVHIYLAKNWSIYENQVFNKFYSKAHRQDMKQDVLKKMSVSEILTNHELPRTVEQHCHLKELFNLITNTTQDLFPVVDSSNKILGLINAHNVRKALYDNSLSSLLIAEDMMERPYYLRKEMDLHLASQLFLRHGAAQMIVVNENKEPIALLRPKEIFKAYDTLVKIGN